MSIGQDNVLDKTSLIAFWFHEVILKLRTHGPETHDLRCGLCFASFVGVFTSICTPVSSQHLYLHTCIYAFVSKRQYQSMCRCATQPGPIRPILARVIVQSSPRSLWCVRCRGNSDLLFFVVFLASTLARFVLILADQSERFAPRESKQCVSRSTV